MSKSIKQAGFAAAELLLVVLVLAVIGVAGWWVYNRSQTPTTSTTGTSESTNNAPAVNSAKDLDNAEKYLNDTDIDKQLDTSEIDQALSE